MRSSYDMPGSASARRAIGLRGGRTARVLEHGEAEVLDLLLQRLFDDDAAEVGRERGRDVERQVRAVVLEVVQDVACTSSAPRHAPRAAARLTLDDAEVLVHAHELDDVRVRRLGRHLRSARLSAERTAHRAADLRAVQEALARARVADAFDVDPDHRDVRVVERRARREAGQRALQHARAHVRGLVLHVQLLGQREVERVPRRGALEARRGRGRLRRGGLRCGLGLRRGRGCGRISRCRRRRRRRGAVALVQAIQRAFCEPSSESDRAAGSGPRRTTRRAARSNGGGLGAQKNESKQKSEESRAGRHFEEEKSNARARWKKRNGRDLLVCPDPFVVANPPANL